MKSSTRVVIVILVAAVAILGYLYYDRTRNDIVIEIPNLEVKP